MTTTTPQQFASVWDAIEDTPQQAASMQARAGLMRGLQAWVKAEGITQAVAAARFGMTQPRVSDLMRGRINLFSTDALIDMAAAAGLHPCVTLKPASKRRAGRRNDAAEVVAA